MRFNDNKINSPCHQYTYLFLKYFNNILFLLNLDEILSFTCWIDCRNKILQSQAEFGTSLLEATACLHFENTLLDLMFGGHLFCTKTIFEG